MRRSISIGAGAVAATVITHGMVSSAMNLTDQGFFQHVVFATWRLWSYAHGWQPMSHVEEFGYFYAHTVQLICPLIGFALFWIVSRHKVGLNCWKPIAIALLSSVPPPFTAMGPLNTLWLEVARTLLALSLMVWSVGAIRISNCGAGLQPAAGL